MVDAELHLKTVFRQLTIRDHHQAGIVDERVNLVMFCAHSVRGFANGGEGGEIEADVIEGPARRCGLQRLNGGARLVFIAAQNGDRRIFFAEHARGFIADAAIAAGDDVGVARKVGQPVGGPAFGAELFCGHDCNSIV